MKKKLFTTSVFLISILTFSQVKENEIIVKDKKGKAELINFNETKIKSDDKSITDFLKKEFDNEQNDFVLKSKEKTNENNLETKKIQQYYKGVKVEHGVQTIVSENGLLKVVSGKFIDVENLSTISKISEKEALEFALKNINAKEYIWQKKENEEFIRKEQNNSNATYFPKGELVIIEKDIFGDNPNPRLAFKFDIYAANPISRDYIYVDAENGEILLKDAIIKHVLGTGTTRYSGQRSFETQQISSSQYKLRDYTRGQGIETLNLQKGTNYSSAIDFVDNDNNWTSAEYNNSNYDNAALDAHWGTQKTYDYFLQKHNRNSYDGNGGKLISYIHFSNSYFNAFWNGQFMTYGDGYGNPLTTLDITGHEIGHGVCEKTAGLIYQNEPGAINEALSDIWGAMIEYYGEPTKQTYQVGEDIGAIRSMSNPKSFNHPDTYQGQYWYTGTSDNGGVHYNSGVFNHWFYILAEGKSGTNDKGNSYNISGIGKENAAKIVYRAETVYFNSSTNYSQARDLTIQAAKDLFGNNSVQAATVCQSWYAVGVGSSCIIPITIEGNQNICGQSNYTYTINNLPSNSVVTWSYSTSFLNFVSSTNNSITVAAKSSTYSGTASVTATINGQSYVKEIWVGKPNFTLHLEPQGINYVMIDMIGASGTDINKQGITSTTWQKVSGSGGCVGSFSGGEFTGLGHGNCNSWSVYAKITATNSCGTTTIYRTITPPAPEECNNYTLANNNGVMSIIIEPCDNPIAPYVSTEIYNYIVYNSSGLEVLNQTNTNLDTSSLQPGIYFVKVFKSNQLILSKTIIK